MTRVLQPNSTQSEPSMHNEASAQTQSSQLQGSTLPQDNR